MANEDCLFCKIVAGDMPSDKLAEDDRSIAFNDISPQAPTHVLVVPKRHIGSLDKASKEDGELLGHLLLRAAEIARADDQHAGGFQAALPFHRKFGHDQVTTIAPDFIICQIAELLDYGFHTFYPCNCPMSLSKSATP